MGVHTQQQKAEGRWGGLRLRCVGGGAAPYLWRVFVSDLVHVEGIEVVAGEVMEQSGDTQAASLNSSLLTVASMLRVISA